jgi:hypothetical protein
MVDRCKTQMKFRLSVPSLISETFMKRVESALTRRLFEQAGLKPVQCAFITGMPSFANYSGCNGGCLVGALYLCEFPGVTKDRLIEADLAWVQSQHEKPDHERTALTHPCVVELGEKGYSLPYVDGLIIGFDGLSRSCGSHYWLANGDETTVAVEYIAGIDDGTHARLLVNPSL